MQLLYRRLLLFFLAENPIRRIRQGVVAQFKGFAYRVCAKLKAYVIVPNPSLKLTVGICKPVSEAFALAAREYITVFKKGNFWNIVSVYHHIALPHFTVKYII